ncbi:MAG: NAD(P)H-quinone oxidoreductase [Pyrinomonadaceae bacterium]
MKAVYIKEFGAVDGLEIRDVPDPSSPAGKQILVRVRAAGLNRADLLQVRGVYPPPPGYSPNIPGLEFAGEVAAMGSEVTGWSIGDRVFGITAGESQAEFLLSDESLLLKIPDNLSYTEAAAVPEAFLTSHDALFTLGELRAGESLLIHAVGSGVGLAALQMAKAKGAFVIGTSRTPEKLENARKFGLDAGISTEEGPIFAEMVKEYTGGTGANLVLDLVGAAYFEQNLASLAIKGRLVLVGLTSGSTTDFDLRAALQKRAKIIGTVLRARPTAEKADATHKFSDDILSLLASASVRPNLEKVFSSDDAIAAYRYLGSNESFGKVVLEF